MLSRSGVGLRGSGGGGLLGCWVGVGFRLIWLKVKGFLLLLFGRRFVEWIFISTSTTTIVTQTSTMTITLHQPHPLIVTSTNIQQVAKCCTRLTELNVSGCRHLGEFGDRALVEIGKHCPDLKVKN
jgi:hypothetical protein